MPNLGEMKMLGLWMVFWTLNTWASESIILDQVEASVNGAVILSSDVQEFRETLKLRSSLDPLFSGSHLAELGKEASFSAVVDYLIDEQLISQQFPKTDAEVEQEISTIQASNHIDRATLREALKKQGHEFSQYFEIIRRSSSKRDLIDREIRAKIVITEDDLKNRYYSHYLKDSQIPRAFHLALLSVEVSRYKNFGAAHQALSQALKRIKNGESFESLAKELSPQDQTGGDLGTLTEDQMAPWIQVQTKKLQIGDLSGIIEAQPGVLAVLKLIDIQSTENERFQKLKEEIRTQLAAIEYRKQIGLWLDRQRQAAFVHKKGASLLEQLKKGASL